MIRLFKHYIPNAVLLLALFDLVLLFSAAEFGWAYRAWQIGMKVEPIHTRILQMSSFAACLELAMIAVGVYGADSLQSIRVAAARLLVAVSLGTIFLSVVFFVVPALTFWRSNLLYAMLAAAVMLFLLRLLLGKTLGSQIFKRRVVVLGAGARAERLKALSKKPGAGFVVVGYVAMSEANRTIPEAIARDAIYNLADHVVLLNASEVVLALEERRNALPLKDLLRIKTTGVHVNDTSTFLERETGRVDLQSVNPSWLIFSDGFSSGRMLSSMFKRFFDIVASLILLVLTLPLVLLGALAVKLESRGPAFYRQRRVGLYGQGFDIIKLRSMRVDAEVGGKAVWAEKDDPRITRVGRFIRKVRIDELPQCWSVLKGEMSFVGPRPERPQFVEDLEAKLPYYAERHMVKPGITGWAQINYPYGASIEDSRQKLEYDLYYAKNYSPFLDVLILLQTLRVVLFPDGAR
ncbi:TIGR03013 family PEP-CTERM/XrtA system glycosyltransferase [Sphingomonas koreensis]|jgi:sugar transferase (PEP-CTERM system associated)|uniref:Sugar transferase n=1 Tax=Sphingomonas koreensis TaxID=93064 RepID=A0A1L6J971_9SPHN|nr:TIGR03013 family XrtA/PEP-CTERM system glycosyltransferase [Sphingomonas koreensis]APR52439.1 sugar transferase [Sphingomonas koreensis]MDC7811603.1 TIGR03013 family PEP-CTERM/XrtA system glycosyltransferase [Sphingomonas koreensis]PJI88096.1 sugar transferase (PEP-CTERM system associated)/exopolysaccharide biosynthesis polyprenyl glycosylphosphotransferase [Sphingomonas koreensis]RSU19671.1 TIGR03013 family PEP-CTERM/XrtA system glycosyltransferase [Sphingomonas koreensis]RSU26459.1 TIGR03